jgi:broad specificity phosphatase PhoE
MTMESKAERRSQKTIFLMRHGETESDGVKRYIGQTDLPLSTLGRQQAGGWCDFFRRIPLAAIFSSDLARTRETAAIIGAGRNMPLIAEPGLREIHLGSWENLPFVTVEKEDPEAFRERGEHIDTFRPPGGESFLDLQQRGVAAFCQAVNQTDDNLLIVAHAGINRVILCHILEMPLGNLFRLAQAYACLNTIVSKEKSFRIVGLNQVGGM